MWLREKEFSIRLGGNTFINIGKLMTFNGESLFDIRRHEDSGEVGIDFDVYDKSGEKLAAVKRNNVYFGDKARFDLTRTESRITLISRRKRPRWRSNLTFPSSPTSQMAD
jgi:hypothetical protein